jgi:hypothetical protein
MSRTHTKPSTEKRLQRRIAAGWSTPVDTSSLRQQLVEVEEKVKELKAEIWNRENAPRLEAIAHIRSILNLWAARGLKIEMSEVCRPDGLPRKSRKKKEK